jgi:hypothetical protein
MIRIILSLISLLGGVITGLLSGHIYVKVEFEPHIVLTAPPPPELYTPEPAGPPRPPVTETPAPEPASTPGPQLADAPAPPPHPEVADAKVRAEVDRVTKTSVADLIREVEAQDVRNQH